jgi:DNA polymerase-1
MGKQIFLEADFGQIEARVIAMASRDRNFTKSLWDRYDVHLNWAEKIAYAYPDRVGGKNNLKDKKVMKTFRGDVKNQWVFPLFFGASLFKVSNELRIPDEHLKSLYDEFWCTFEGVKDYQNRMEKDYKKKGYVECLTGRRRRAPLSYNQIINSPIQGTASDIVVDGMNRLSELEDWEYQANLNIHDSLTFILDEDELEERTEVIVREMLGCRFPFINVPLTVEVSIGTENWQHMQELGTFSSDEWLDWPKRPSWA